MTELTIRLDDADVAVLMAFLVEEHRGQDELHQALEGLERQIVTGDATELSRGLVALKPLLERLEGLAPRRKKVLGHFAKKANLERIHLDDFIAAAPEGSREKLQGTRSRLRDLTLRTRQLNGRVNMLLRHAMSFNRELLRGIFDLADPQVTYSANGQTSEQGDQVILDRSF